MFSEMKEKTYIKLACKILYSSKIEKNQLFIFDWMVLILNQMSYVQTYKMNLCVCFAYDMSLCLDKVSIRIIKCVFLGFSCHKKLIIVLLFETKRYYMSTNVTLLHNILSSILLYMIFILSNKSYLCHLLSLLFFLLMTT